MCRGIEGIAPKNPIKLGKNGAILLTLTLMRALSLNSRLSKARPCCQMPSWRKHSYSASSPAL
jgi:hypothetical protein